MLVLVNLDGDDVILCQITSKSVKDNLAIAISNDDIENGSLNEVSNLRSQMIDIWEEINKCVNKPCNSLENQLDLVHKLCLKIYSNPKISDGFKYELKVAQWELYDFCLWGNRWNNSKESLMSAWFDLWLYEINYDLL